MTSYIERSAQLAVESSIAAWVLMGAPNDVEFVPLRPKMADATWLAELKARWPGRLLRAVGVIGLCGTSPRCVLKEPLSPEQVSALANAFLVYVETLLGDSFAQQQKDAEIEWLNRLYARESLEN
jgi:hypothetical protein